MIYTVKFSNLMPSFDSFQEVSKIRPNKIEFLENLSFLKFLMIQFDRIELATCLRKRLDQMDFKAKDTLNSSSVRSEPNHEKY